MTIMLTTTTTMQMQIISERGLRLENRGFAGTCARARTSRRRTTRENCARDTRHRFFRDSLAFSERVPRAYDDSALPRQTREPRLFIETRYCCVRSTFVFYKRERARIIADVIANLLCSVPLQFTAHQFLL